MYVCSSFPQNPQLPLQLFPLSLLDVSQFNLMDLTQNHGKILSELLELSHIDVETLSSLSGMYNHDDNWS